MPLGYAVPISTSPPEHRRSSSAIHRTRRAHVAEFGGDPLTPDQVPVGEADVVLECVGRSETTLAATHAVRAGGTVVWVGVARGNRPRESLRYLHLPAGNHDPGNVYQSIHDGSFAGDSAIRRHPMETCHYSPVALCPVPGSVGCARAQPRPQGLRGAKCWLPTIQTSITRSGGSQYAYGIPVRYFLNRDLHDSESPATT